MHILINKKAATTEHRKREREKITNPTHRIFVSISFQLCSMHCAVEIPLIVVRLLISYLSIFHFQTLEINADEELKNDGGMRMEYYVWMWNTQKEREKKKSKNNIQVDL